MFLNDLSSKEFGEYLKNYINEFSNIKTVEKAGEGNMNITLRVINDLGKSVIVKQSPPFCAKYPSIPAPENRAISEAHFYEIVSKNESLKNYFPGIVFKDEKNHVLAIKDLGKGSDFLEVYKTNEFLDEDLIYLTKALSNINNQVMNPNLLENKEMRKLNYEYIFVQPLENIHASNLESITEGLTEASRILTQNNTYKNKVKDLGNIYLGSGNSLCHGDYYPGSWIKTSDQVWIIDPEFGYIGRSEFDYGVMLAHLYLAKLKPAKIELFIKNYQAPKNFDLKIAIQFAGTEIMRRILGVAQLPLNYSLKEKQELLDLSLKMVLK